MIARLLLVLFSLTLVAPAWAADDGAADTSATGETVTSTPEPTEPSPTPEIPNPMLSAETEVMAPPVEARDSDGIAIMDETTAESPIQLAQAPLSMPLLLILQPGEVKTLSVDELERVAVGNPEVVDISVVSEDVLLVKANAPGTSNLIVWDRAGQHAMDVTVAPALPESVKLTVQVVEMNRDATDDIGVDWSDTLTFAETTFGALGPNNVSEIARMGEAFRFGALSRSGASAVLSFLAKEGKARVLAEPKLVASSGKSATAFIGIEVPVITVTSISSGTVSQNIEFKKTGVELTFQPTVIQGSDQIQLAVNAKVSSIDTVNSIVVAGITVPGFRIRQAETEIVTGSGQSVFIAGLIQEDERKNISQLPGIGSIPILGILFRSTEFVRGQTELVIIITPRLRTQAEMVADRAASLEHALSSSTVSAQIRKNTKQ